MIAAGIGDGIAQPCLLRVIAAHNPLKFREFIHHFRTQVGLGHLRGQCGLRRIRAHGWRNLRSQRGDARDAFRLRPQFVVEGHIRQWRAHAGQAFTVHRAQVVFPEKLGIRQTGRQNLLVTRQNGRALIFGFDIGDRHKFFDPACARIADREKFLVLFHRGLQNLGRQAKEIVANRAHQHNRPFHKSRHLGQKPLILNHLEPKCKGLIGRVVPDGFSAFIRTQNHMRAFQFGFVILERGHGKGGWRHEPVALGGVP